MNKALVSIMVLALTLAVAPFRADALAPEQRSALATGTVAALATFTVSSMWRFSRDENILTPKWEWTTTDTVLQVGVTLSLIADMMTTLDIRHHPNSYETNVFLGRQPSDAEVKRLMIAEMVGHAIVSRLLPNPYRNIWQGFTIGMEYDCVSGNLQGGLKLRMPF